MEKNDATTNNGSGTFKMPEEGYPMQLPTASAELSGRPTVPPRVEIAHVLFMDIVGYSLLDFSLQGEVQLQLQRIVQETETVRRARAEQNVILRPTGDGMAILFLKDLLSPIRCALEVDETLKSDATGIKKSIRNRLRLRMGIHTGPVLMVEDINLQSDVAGEGIIMAQRVMDCGDAGHLLLSEEFARVLGKIDPWPRYLNDIGICWVKHGVPVHLFNLYGRRNGARGAHTFGNGNRPQKLVSGAAQVDVHASRISLPPRWVLVSLIVLLCLGGGIFALVKMPRSTVLAIEKQIAKIKADLTPKPGKNPGKNVKSKTGKATVAKVEKSEKVERGYSEEGMSDGGRSTGRGAAARLEVPDLKTLSFEDAQLVLAQTGLALRRSEKSDYNTSYEKGSIYQQEPPAGKKCLPGTKIYVRVSKGDPPDHTDDNLNPDGTVKSGVTPL